MFERVRNCTHIAISQHERGPIDDQSNTYIVLHLNSFLVTGILSMKYPLKKEDNSIYNNIFSDLQMVKFEINKVYLDIIFDILIAVQYMIQRIT